MRYESAGDAESPPVVLIQVMPEDAAQISFLSSRGSAGFSLEAPGDAIVVRALRDVRLVATTATLAWPGAAVLTIERIDGQAQISRRPGPSIATVELIDTASSLAGSAPPPRPVSTMRSGGFINIDDEHVSVNLAL